MTKNIRIMDIARKAGVSIGTVDRVIHNRGEVSEETKKKILQIIKDFDYRPNILASSLASKKVITFASLTPMASDKDSFWAKPQEGILKAINQLSQYGIRFKQFNFKMEDPETFDQEANKIIELSPDGVLLAPWAKRESLKFTQELDRLNIPYVFIDSNLKESHPISFVVQNSLQSGCLAAKLLNYGIGPKCNILILHITSDLSNTYQLLQREKGFIDYFESFQNHHKIIKMAVSEKKLNITDALNRCIKENQKIDAIYVTNSRVHQIADFFAQFESRPKIIGYDLIPKNMKCLELDKIDFLLNQNPEIQGFTAIHILFDRIVKKENVKSFNYTSIDIIAKENLEFYASI